MQSRDWNDHRLVSFVSQAANRFLLFFKLLKKGFEFEWIEECEQALTQLKAMLSEPPILTRPIEEETLCLYLAVLEEALNAVLIWEIEEGQQLVYFVNKALQGPKLRYQKVGKVALALVIIARWLRPYFVAHIIVKSNQPIRQILH